MTLPSFARLLERVAVAAQVQELVVTAIALERYYREHSKYPRELSELNPPFLEQAPWDFFAGAPLLYRPEGKLYLLYSVGANGRDDGGDASDERNQNRFNGNFGSMRDIVWPLPATAEEIRAEFGEQAKE